MINSETTQNTVNSIYEVFKSNIVLENKNTSTKSTSQQTQDNITSFSKQIKTEIIIIYYTMMEIDLYITQSSTVFVS